MSNEGIKLDSWNLRVAEFRYCFVLEKKFYHQMNQIHVHVAQMLFGTHTSDYDILEGITFHPLTVALKF